jgi:predicted TIM-barrel fold metal-dependent hydrolase
MIIDSHTHVFAPAVKDDRASYLQRDATFKEMYSNPDVALATAEELLASMDEAGIDKSVICGFGWSDAELCAEHNDYLLEAAERSGGRLIPFCTIQPGDKAARDDVKRWAARGAHGLGELRPESQGYKLIDSDEADLLAWASDAYDLVLLFHASEPVGHPYPGKKGLPVDQLGRFVADFPGIAVIGAHWGGGLPFYALMPEMREAMRRTYFDCAATGFLYEPEVALKVVDLVGANHVLFGSDYPLVSQEKALDDLRSIGLADSDRRLVEGENVRELLRLADG